MPRYLRKTVYCLRISYDIIYYVPLKYGNETEIKKRNITYRYNLLMSYDLPMNNIITDC